MASIDMTVAHFRKRVAVEDLTRYPKEIIISRL